MTPEGKVSSVPPLPAPSASERAAIEQAKRRVEERTPRVTVSIRQIEGAKVDLRGGGHRDHEGWLARIEDAFGSRGTDFAVSQLNQLMTACQDGNGKVDGVRLNAMLAMIEGSQPQNELQAALAVQMAMTHSATTVLLNRAMRVDQIPQFEAAGNMAVKFARTFALQAETLAKLQRGGEQIVKVVHLHAGAQAVIGNVTTGANGANGSGTGEGATHENFNQPHAKAELPAPSAQPMPQMWGEVPERQPVPVARGRG